MKVFEYHQPIAVMVMVHNSEELRAVYAVLGGLGKTAMTVSGATGEPGQIGAQVGLQTDLNRSLGTQIKEFGAADMTAGKVQQPAEDLDSNGDPWDETKHAATKTKNKDGTWKAKRGAASTEAGPPKTSPAPSDEEDEFAAMFNKGASASSAPITDAELSACCNEAAQALGSAEKVKQVIADFVPEGEVAHSRNVPLDKRADFMQEIKGLIK